MQTFVDKGLYDVFKNQSYPKRIIAASLLGYKKDGKVVAVFVNEFPKNIHGVMDAVCIASHKDYPFVVGGRHSMISPLLDSKIQSRLFTQGCTEELKVLMEGVVLCELAPRDVAFAVREWIGNDDFVEIERREYERIKKQNAR